MADEIVRAAGGVIVRRGPTGEAHIAIVHRPAYDDWSFPKGKLMDGESFEEAALREVREETGLQCELGLPAGRSSYRDRRDRPKVVRYWLMRPLDGRFAPNSEVDELRWMPPAEAVEALTYSHDREILEEVLDDLNEEAVGGPPGA
ncbi:MAG TPA: NUDIX hydrolase [Actinomycetota bacterium]|nr:NUDIX hydrolase [Actinomycetota bacterium]